MHILSQRGESLSDEMDRVVFEQLGPTVSETKKKEKDRRRDRERKRRRFSSICLYKHTILGTHFQAQTDGLVNVNTQKCT